jgi:hypothetical protein
MKISLFVFEKLMKERGNYMYFNQNRVINVNSTETYVKDKQLRIGVPASEENIQKLELDIESGETSILPSPLKGINCSRNAIGECIADKSQNKEPRTINTVYWSWKDWSGKEYSDWCDVTKDCYPKKLIPPTGIEIQLSKHDGKKFLSSIVEVENFEESQETIKIALNMFLEIFGCCYVYNEDFNFNPFDVKRCQWQLLPEGERIWVSEQNNLKKRQNAKSENSFFQHRLDILNSFSPTEKYVGTNGFAGYFAFIFGKYCIFESGWYGNATYVVASKDWERLSQMTKQELFASNNVIERFTHTKSWDGEIGRFMKNAA